MFFIQASAVGFYGTPGDQILTEKCAPGNDFLARLCMDWEQMCAALLDTEVRLVLIRTGVVLDPNAGALSRMLPPFQFFFGGCLGHGKQWFPWIHVDDVVRGIEYCMQESGLSGPVNLVSPNPLTNRDFSKALASVLKRPCWAPVPAFVLRIVFGEMSVLLLEGQRVKPEKLENAEFKFQFPEAEVALTDLLSRDN